MYKLPTNFQNISTQLLPNS